ncbi:MAG: tetratricopeptide repeat protein [Planctomycetota bacterium]
MSVSFRNPRTYWLALSLLALILFILLASSSSTEDPQLIEVLERLNRADRKTNERSLQQVSALVEKSILAQKISSLLCLRLGHFQEAIKILTSMKRTSYEEYILAGLQQELQVSPEEILWNRLPEETVYFTLSQLRQAIASKSSENPLLLFPEENTVVFQEPDAYLLRGRLTKSKSDFQKGLAIEPTNLFLKLHLAYCLLEENRIQETETLLQEPDLFVEIRFASLVFGFLAEKKGQGKQAENLYLQSIQQELPEAFFRYGSFLMQQKRPAEALRYLTLALQSEVTAEKLFVRGQLYEQMSQDIEALTDLEKAFLLQPEHSGVLLAMAKLHFKAKNYKEAQIKAESFLNLKSNPEALKVLAYSHYYQKNLEAALKTIGRWIEFDIEGYRLRAEIFFNQKNYAQSIDDCTRLIEADKADAQTFFIRGQSYFFLKDYEPAHSNFQKVRVLNPKEYRVLFYLARIYDLQNNKEEALKSIEELLSQNPDENPEYILYRGELYTYKNSEKALEDFSRFIQRKPDDARGYYKRALLQISLQNYSLAKKDLDWLLSKYPEEAEYYYQRGKLHVATQQNLLAHDDFQACLQRNPEQSDAITAQGLLLFQEKRFDEAVQTLCLVKPQDSNYQVSQSFLIRAKRFSQTMIYLKAAPQTGNEAYEIGIYYLDGQKEDEALNAFKQSLTLDPTFFYSHVELARIYARRKQDDALFKELESAIKLGYRDTNELKMDLAFALIRAHPKFKEMLEMIETLEKTPQKNNK